jgi:tRNA(Ile)-lysidine synthase
VAEASGVARPYGGPGFDVVEVVRKALDRHSMIEKTRPAVVAVSGGPDSMCLLDVLVRLKGHHGAPIEVVHVDHGLSADSAKVAARVANHAASLGLEVHVTRAPDLSGPNLQARAREFRYGFLEIVAGRVDAGAVATGHTLDDRVETTLARLIHGAPTEGLAGLRPVEGNRVRPLIEIRRSETRAYCTEVGIEFFDDPANSDERFERVRVRNEVVPAIERGWGEGAVRAMARSAERLSEDASALGDLADRLYADVARGEGGEITVATAAMLTMPRAFRRKVLERAVGRVRDRHAGIEAVLDFLDRGDDAAQQGGSFAVAAGIEISVDRETVRVTRPSQ